MKIIDDIMKFVMGPSAGANQEVVAALPALPLVDDEPAQIVLFDDALQNGAYFFDQGELADYSSEGDPTLGASSIALQANAWQQAGIATSQTVTAETRYLELDLYRVDGAGGSLTVRAGPNWVATQLDASNYGTAWSVEGVETFESLASLPADVWQHITVDLVTLLGEGATFKAITVFGDRDGGESYFMDNVVLSEGGASSDIIYVDDSYSSFTGTDADEHIISTRTTGGIIIDGGGGDDIIESDGVGNLLIGGDGNDTLINTGIFGYFDAGEGSADGNGNDTYIADENGAHTMYDRGSTVNIQVTGTTFTASVGDNGETDTLTNVDSFQLSVVDDTFSVAEGGSFAGFSVDGGMGNDTLSGGSLGDILSGNIGDDTLSGNAGDDILSGGRGNNVLTGGVGRDLFVLASTGTSASDIITDFSTVDAIGLNGSGANLIGTDTFTGAPNEIRYYQDGNDTIIELDSDGDGVADTTTRLEGFSGDLALVTEFNYSNDAHYSESYESNISEFLVAADPVDPVDPPPPSGNELVLFDDALQNGAYFFDRSVLAELSGESDPALNTSSIALHSDAWQQSGIASTQTVTAETRYLELDLYRVDGSGGSLSVRAGSNWAATTLDASNYGTAWSVEGVETFEGLAALPSEEWQHITVDLLTLLGDGATFRAITVFGDRDGGERYFMDNVVLTDATGGGSANAAPVAVNDIAAIETGPQAILDVLTNDTDADEDTLTITHINGVELGLNETLTLDDGAIAENLGTSIGLTAIVAGDISLDYTVSDGELSDTATVDVTVTGNSAPVARDDAFSVTGGHSETIYLTANDSDPESYYLNITSINGQTFANNAVIDLEGGNYILIEYGYARFFAASDFEGDISFNYTVSDEQGATDEATVTVSITPNSAPIAEDDAFSVIGGRPTYVYLTSNDLDPDGDSTSITHINGQAVFADALIDVGDGNFVRFSSGSTRFYAASEFTGDVTFTYTISDGYGDSDEATATISVKPNSTPIAEDDTYEALGGHRTYLYLLDNDSDPDGDRLTITHINGEPASSYTTIDLGDGNQLEIGARNPRFIGGSDFEGDVTFTYTVSDGFGGSSEATATITVTPNSTPIAVDDTYQAVGGHTSYLHLSNNDSDPDGDHLTITHINGEPASGYMTIDLDDGNQIEFNYGNPRFIAASDFEGDVTFTYTVSDGFGGSSEATAMVSVTPNSAPVAVDDTFEAIGGHITSLDLIRNDTDADGDNLTITHINGNPVSSTTVVDLGDGNQAQLYYNSVRFTGASDYDGDVSFTYMISDAYGGTTEATATVSVTPNSVPVAEDDAYEATGGHAIYMNLRNNDTDTDGDYLAITHINGQPASGSMTIDLGDGHLLEFNYSNPRFIGASDFEGDVTFTYTVSDGFGGSSEATATISVTPNSAPVAEDDTIDAIGRHLTYLNLLGNDSDADGDAMTVSHINGDPVSGPMVVDLGNGHQLNYSYGNSYITSPDDFEGDVTFTYTVSDEYGGSSEATATVSVTPNSAPVAEDDAFSVVRGTSISLSLALNDSDPDGDYLTITHINGEALSPNGTIDLGDGNQIGSNSYDTRFLSADDFEGDVTFTYTVSDGYGGSADATATVTVTPNLAPTAVDDDIQVSEGRSTDIYLLGNDTDETDLLTITHINGEPVSGSMTIDLEDGNQLEFYNGSTIFTSPVGFVGDVSFTYTVSDGYGGTDQATATVSVAPDIAGSVATLETLSVGENASSTIDFSGDQDWFAVELVEGGSYRFSQFGTGDNAIGDTYLRLYDATGSLITVNDDSNGTVDSEINYTSTEAGTYYISAGGYNSHTGEYTIEMVSFEPLTEWSAFEIADYLTSGFWSPARRWVDTNVSVNIEGLTAGAQTLAGLALDLWDDISGLNFTYTTGVADITFDDEVLNRAYASLTYGPLQEDGYLEISSVEINVASNWNGGNLDTDSYTLQAFVHEVGHAIGLGHAGPYNGSATYGIDNLYLNDSWAMTVMSYFSQTEAGTGDYRYTLAPQLADVVAVQNLYDVDDEGVRTGDTVYGFNSTETDLNDWTQFAGSRPPSMAIVDDGGVDTIDLSGYSAAQFLILNPGSQSSLGERTSTESYQNVISVAYGTIIENAIGGTGNDILVGSGLSNVLRGGLGADLLIGLNLASYYPADVYLYDDTLLEIDFDRIAANLNDTLSFFFEGGAAEVGSVTWIDNEEFSGVGGEIRWRLDGEDLQIEYDADGDGVLDGSLSVTSSYDAITLEGFSLDETSATGFVISISGTESASAEGSSVSSIAAEFEQEQFADLGDANAEFTFDALPASADDHFLCVMEMENLGSSPQDDGEQSQPIDKSLLDEDVPVSEWIEFDTLDHFLI